MDIDTLFKEIDFIQYTPNWMVKIVADGAVGIGYLLPSILSIVIYAWICFWLVDFVISFITNIILKKVTSIYRVRDMKIGQASIRSQFFFSHFLEFIVKTWIGLPVFHVTNLLLMDDKVGIEKLSNLITGYNWQNDALHIISTSSMSQIQISNTAENFSQIIIVSVFLIFTYAYFYKGFDLIRRIREIGDVLMLTAKQHGISNPTHREAYLVTRNPNSSLEEKEALIWFFLMYNLRITIKNPSYADRTPDEYAKFKVIMTFSLAASLTFVHPIVSGLYLATALKGVGKLRSTIKLYNKKFCYLPKDIQILVLEKYGKIP